MIQIIFEKTNDTYGTFRDALYLPDDHSLTEAEIESMKQQRFDSWIDAINQPSVETIEPVEATEDILEQK